MQSFKGSWALTQVDESQDRVAAQVHCKGGSVHANLQWLSGDGQPAAWRLPSPAGQLPSLLASAPQVANVSFSSSTALHCCVPLFALAHGRLQTLQACNIVLSMRVANPAEQESST